MFSLNPTRNVFGAVALTLAGCGTPAPAPTQSFDSGTPSRDTGRVPTDNSPVIMDRAPVTPDVVRPRDVAVTVDSSNSDASDASTSPDTTVPRSITFTVNRTFGTVSCGGAPSDLYADASDLYFVCSGGPNRIGRLSLTTGTTSTWRIELPNIRGTEPTFPNAYTPINDMLAVVTADTGFYIISRTGAGSVVDRVGFPTGLKFGGRAFYRNGQIAVPFGNAPQPASFSDPVIYGPGQVRIYTIDSTGHITNRDNPNIITTRWRNPTAITAVNENQIAVQCSGSFVPTTPDELPGLQFINTSGATWTLMSEFDTPLTPVGMMATYTASPATPLIVANGRAYIGSANRSVGRSDKVIVVDTSTRRIEAAISVPRSYTSLAGLFHSGITWGAGLLYVSEFSTNSVSILDPSNPSSMVEASGISVAGCSVFAAPYVYVTDGSGHIVRIQASY